MNSPQENVFFQTLSQSTGFCFEIQTPKYKLKKIMGESAAGQVECRCAA